MNALPLQPPPGHSSITMGQYGRVQFTPPVARPALAVQGEYTREDSPGGCVKIRDADGYCWGTFGSLSLAEATAGKLSP